MSIVARDAMVTNHSFESGLHVATSRHFDSFNNYTKLETSALSRGVLGFWGFGVLE